MLFLTEHFGYINSQQNKGCSGATGCRVPSLENASIDGKNLFH
jgi:hypothetical protein